MTIWSRSLTANERYCQSGSHCWCEIRSEIFFRAMLAAVALLVIVLESVQTALAWRADPGITALQERVIGLPREDPDSARLEARQTALNVHLVLGAGAARVVRRGARSVGFPRKQGPPPPDPKSAAGQSGAKPRLSAPEKLRPEQPPIWRTLERR